MGEVGFAGSAVWTVEGRGADGAALRCRAGAAGGTQNEARAAGTEAARTPLMMYLGARRSGRGEGEEPEEGGGEAAETQAVRALEESTRAGFRRRNLFSLRAIGDGASTVLLYDFLSSLADGCVTFSIDMFGQQSRNPVFDFHQSGLELLIGAALGVATVKTLLQTTLNRRRAQDEQRGARLGKEAAVIAKEWNLFLNSIDYVLDCANLLSVGRIAKQHEVMTEDDVDSALMWMETMEEYEGDMAINILRKFEHSPIQSVRLRLARGLGLLNAQSNVIAATLARLMQDSDYQVRNVADAALKQFLKRNAAMATPAEQEEAAFSGLKHSLVAVQEVQTDGEDAAFAAMRGGFNEAPVDKIDVLDVHTLCVVSALALATEVICVALNQPVPFRLLGIGWVLAVAGLAVYPYSSQAWQRFLVPVKSVAASEDDLPRS
ncbi:hypothetical protein FVE85_7572 [Porphyridium purpureum]|uniref:Uncharacterized protein n=1 Tax=Porphyridium purpureum TaxID=35688 RepID=A0A5J4ZBF7_PORPP|nr:hypothetical protein FVE85_7572 [Porphyridium purpureum]|eukprot:POR8426..scf295_1